jgi:subtilisin family serine protease
MNLRCLALGLVCLNSLALATEQDVRGAYRHVHETLSLTKGLQRSPLTLIVRYKQEAPEAAREHARAALGATALHKFRFVPNMEVLYVPGGTIGAMARLQNNPNVASVGPDLIVKGATVPNDPNFGLQYGMQTSLVGVNAIKAWQVSTGTASFPIAVVDSGIDLTHPELAANVWTNPDEVVDGLDNDGNGYVDDINGYDFHRNDTIPEDELGHGTHVSGIIGAIGNNGIGVAGVNWSCKIMPLKFIGPQNEGLLSDALRALEYSVVKGARVSNHSWYSGESTQELELAFSSLGSQVTCAAAGNSGGDLAPSWFEFYPAEYAHLPHIIAVASTNDTGALSTFSNFGQAVRIAAPGSDIFSTLPNGMFGYMSGTSMSTPMVAGAAALVLSQNPSWTTQQVVDRLLRTARPTTTYGTLIKGGKFLDLAAAVTSASKPAVSVTSPTDGAILQSGVSVSFSATATDLEDGNVAGGLTWLSNLQGQIGTGASFSLSNLSLGTHYIRAATTDSSGLVGAAGFTITITTPPPSTPTGISATKVAALTARVTWTDVSNETSYEIQREKKVGSSWAQLSDVGSVGANVTQFTNSPGTGTFRYRVRATNAAGSSAYSAWSAQVKL